MDTENRDTPGLRLRSYIDKRWTRSLGSQRAKIQTACDCCVSRMLRFLASLLLICGLLGCSTVQLDPDAGKVTFGRSIDTTTFVLSGERSTFGVGQDVAYRAALSKVMGPGSIRLQGALDGTTVLDQTAQVDEAAWTLYVGTLPGGLLFGAGTFRLRVLDIGNNVLADGSFTVTE